MQIEYIARLLRVLQQEVEEMQRGVGRESSADVARELAAP
jgi:hypothetical protein